MSDRETLNGNMPKQSEEDPRQDQGVPGEPKEMSAPETSSMNTSSPTPTPTDSPSTTGSRSEPRLFEMEESPASSSNAPVGESNSTSSPQRTEAPDWDATVISPHTKLAVTVAERFNSDEKIERDREGTLVIHFSTYGTANQKLQTAKRMIDNIHLKGFGIIQASLDGTEIHVE